MKARKITEPNPDLLKEPLNDYSSAPNPVTIDENLDSTMGTSTGETEHAAQAGGWQGTDDATSTAPSDVENLSSTEGRDVPLEDKLEAEDSTRRAYGGGIGFEEGGVTDLTGKPVEEARDWEKNPV